MRTKSVRRSAWWIYEPHQGRLIILGPYADSTEAEQDNWSKLSGEGKVVELPTIDRTRARDIARKRTLDETSNLDEALRRAKYKVQKGE